MKRLLAGLVFIAALVLVGFQFKNHSSYKEKNYVLDETIQVLDIQEENNAIKIIENDDNDANIKISYSENDKIKYDIKQENGRLVMKKRKFDYTNIFSWFNFDFSNHSIVVEMSQDKLKELSVSTVNSKITLENVKAERADISTTNGKIDITDSTFSKEIDASTTNGKIIFDDCFAHKGILGSTNGKISFQDANIQKSLKINTTNASVKGSLQGRKQDFSINSKTTNGKNSLDNTNNSDSKKTLDITTTNGSIDVDFNND